MSEPHWSDERLVGIVWSDTAIEVIRQKEAEMFADVVLGVGPLTYTEQCDPVEPYAIPIEDSHA